MFLPAGVALTLSLLVVTLTRSPMLNLLVEAGVIVSVNEVVCVIDPEVPVRVMGYDPVGVDGEVVRLSVEVHLGVQKRGENDEDTPVGRADVENDTD